MVVDFPSSNWFALQKSTHLKRTRTHDDRPRKRPKIDRSSFSAPTQSDPDPDLKNGESLASLKEFVLAHRINIPENRCVPGKYLALDCEMVGVGIDGSESSLARVSVVNFHGDVLLDEFVRQQEKVVDYRTPYSGIRPSDMVKAKHFKDVQQRVSDLLKDRILIGHALYNDLKALLLSHPRKMIRDTQHLSGKHKVVKTKRVSLRNLVSQELGITIQDGEHSSVTDARATMAIYRIHRKKWERGMKVKPAASKGKRKKENDGEGDQTKKSTSKRNVVNHDTCDELPPSPESTTAPAVGTSSRFLVGGVSREKKKWWKEHARRI